MWSGQCKLINKQRNRTNRYQCYQLDQLTINISVSSNHMNPCRPSAGTVVLRSVNTMFKLLLAHRRPSFHFSVVCVCVCVCVYVCVKVEERTPVPCPAVVRLKIAIWMFEMQVLLWRCDPTWVMASSFLRFLDHTHRRTTVGTTPLDE